MRIGRTWACSITVLGFSVAPVLHAEAPVSPTELAQCAQIAAADPRLACFDALARRNAVQPSVRATPAAPAATAAAPSAPVAASAPAPAGRSPDDPQNFGLSLSQLSTKSKTPTKSITAHISGLSASEPGKSRIVLDNDQTWQVMDDDGLLGVGNEVTIRHASLGSFLMYAPSHHTYRVHRIR